MYFLLTRFTFCAYGAYWMTGSPLNHSIKKSYFLKQLKQPFATPSKYYGSFRSNMSPSVLCVLIMMMMMMTGIYIALYPKAQSALQHFVGDFARLLFYRRKLQPLSLQSYYDNRRIHRCPLIDHRTEYCVPYSGTLPTEPTCRRMLICH